MSIIQKWNSISLVKRIVCGLIIGAILGLLIPQVKVIGVLGTLFVGALKAVAPILVFFLVIAALACGQEGGGRTMGRVVALYLMVHSQRLLLLYWLATSSTSFCLWATLLPQMATQQQAALVKYSPIC